MKPRPETVERDLAPRLLAEIAGLSDRPVRLMEVCGTHTIAIFRAGIKSLLPGTVELISGPGCPVCVTPTAEIDQAIALVQREGDDTRDVRGPHARSREQLLAAAGAGDGERCPGDPLPPGCN